MVYVRLDQRASQDGELKSLEYMSWSALAEAAKAGSIAATRRIGARFIVDLVGMSRPPRANFARSVGSWGEFIPPVRVLRACCNHATQARDSQRPAEISCLLPARWSG